ncbi:MAG: hypothetical protein K6D03_09590 [Solobacterium sp.]|nr:hypothetical protein [Solobacterium sp.]
MTSKDLEPYLTKFVMITSCDGVQHSGYISNPRQIRSGDPEVRLVNGLYTESVKIEDILMIDLAQRQDTVSIPVIDLKEGYGAGEDGGIPENNDED